MVVPKPPCPIMAAAWASTSPCGHHCSTRAFARPGREVGGVDASPDGHQHPGVEAGQAVQRIAEDAVEVPERPGDRAERHVDQRPVGVAPHGEVRRPSASAGSWKRRYVAASGGKSPAAWSRASGTKLNTVSAASAAVACPSASPASRPSSSSGSATPMAKAVGYLVHADADVHMRHPGALGGRQ